MKGAKRSFVVVGTKATASPSFSLSDLPGTSGRLDVLLRCARAALLVSHGIRRDTCVYLLLLGGELAPRVIRIDGAAVRFIRPDERTLGVLAQKALARAPVDSDVGVFVEIRAGLAVARGGADVVIADLERRGAFVPLVLDEDAPDLRTLAIDGASHVAVFVGDHFGFDDVSRTHIAALDPIIASVGPVSVHADDAIAILSNELDRRAVSTPAGAAASDAEGSP